LDFGRAGTVIAFLNLIKQFWIFFGKLLHKPIGFLAVLTLDWYQTATGKLCSTTALATNVFQLFARTISFWYF
jgi:hypothetical protein